MRDLDLEVEDFEKQIDVFKAEEKVRAAIAEANYRAYLERQKEKTSPQDESQVEHLTMEGIPMLTAISMRPPPGVGGNLEEGELEGSTVIIISK